MSNQVLQAVIVAFCLVQLAGLIWALVPHGRRWGVFAATIISSAGLLVFLGRELPSELATLAILEDPGFDDYKTTLLTVVEIAFLVSAILALRRYRVPMVVSWIGFVVNFAMSLFLFYFAFFVRFPCCGYL